MLIIIAIVALGGGGAGLVTATGGCLGTICGCRKRHKRQSAKAIATDLSDVSLFGGPMVMDYGVSVGSVIADPRVGGGGGGLSSLQDQLGRDQLLLDRELESCGGVAADRLRQRREVRDRARRESDEMMALYLREQQQLAALGEQERQMAQDRLAQRRRQRDEALMRAREERNPELAAQYEDEAQQLQQQFEMENRRLQESLMEAKARRQARLDSLQAEREARRAELDSLEAAYQREKMEVEQSLSSGRKENVAKLRARIAEAQRRIQMETSRRSAMEARSMAMSGGLSRVGVVRRPTEILQDEVRSAVMHQETLSEALTGIHTAHRDRLMERLYRRSGDGASSILSQVGSYRPPSLQLGDTTALYSRQGAHQASLERQFQAEADALQQTLAERREAARSRLEMRMRHSR